MTHRLTIDLVTQRPVDGAFILVLVEEGPWDLNTIDDQLRRIQERLYNCIDTAIDGHLAAKFPASRGGPIVIRLDCYDTPDEPVRDFMKRFADHVANSAEIQAGLTAQGFVRSLDFEYNWRILERRS